MTQSTDQSKCLHRIGQKYDERRGTGNGPQICLLCDKTLDNIINTAVKEARIKEAKYKYVNLVLSDVDEFTWKHFVDERIKEIEEGK